MHVNLLVHLETEELRLELSEELPLVVIEGKYVSGVPSSESSWHQNEAKSNDDVRKLILGAKL
jgi:hypothetical protein